MENAGKPSILVVDDEWTMRELLKNVLILYGFAPSLASNASEFRAIAFQKKFDAIILDIMLGECDGISVYNELLDKGLNPKIPVVFLSALASDRPPTFPKPDRKYALVGKPFDPDELVKQLRNAVLAA